MSGTGQDNGTGRYAGPAASPRKSRLVTVLLIAIAVLAVAVLVVGVLVIRDVTGEDAGPAAATVTNSAQASSPASEAPSAAPSPSAVPQPPVPGAYVGGGGPRPAGAIALPTYVGRYSSLRSAHLVTPTGRIGCDFNAAAADGRQGLCAITAYNKPSSPLGCVERVGTCKGKWQFPLAENRVGEATDASGTTGWMNQPANDGYRVPTAEYGKQYFFENWVCASESTGLTCWNTTTGSGVFLSIENTVRFDGPGGTAPADSPSASGPIVLGAPQSGGKGYGTAEPTALDLGGASSTSQMNNITWTGWGSDQATGQGTGNYQPPNETAVHIQSGVPGTVVAFAPGTCNGQRAYTKVVYYFPSKGETFNPDNGIDICTSR